MAHNGTVVIDGEEVKVEVTTITRIRFLELLEGGPTKITARLLANPKFSEFGFISVENSTSGLIIEGSGMAQPLVAHAHREVCAHLSELLGGSHPEPGGGHNGGSHLGIDG